MKAEPVYFTSDMRIYPAETVVYRDGTTYRVRQIDKRVGGRWVPSFDVREIGG